jgi:hypothetical protein
MPPIGLWAVGDDGPAKLGTGNIDLERRLEEWIERDPGLLDSGLEIVGRQIYLEAGPLDLLAIDPQGRWVIIEIKRGAVRRDTIAQALDYASCIATMPYEQLAEKVNAYLASRPGQAARTLEGILAERGSEADAQATPRTVEMFVVGTGRDAGLDRMVTFLTGTYDIPISVVSYEVFATGAGQQILVRELNDVETSDTTGGRRPSATLESVCAVADSHGVGPPFRSLLAGAERWGLYARAYKWSIMYTPPSNRARGLFTVWAVPKVAGTLPIYVDVPKFAEYWPSVADLAQEVLGPPEWRNASPADCEALISGLDKVFGSINAESSTTD